ncbi:substrate-binding domain-containing protein [Anaerotalea alkaliphila]|uniref:Sugar ABC transporter substrate-binding protein n=1 Tax=Anaerotalea alkaliphila TaxID=2662126 RepID=A0A7X5KMK4_9FIRM|nr:substrate-binding domain-containing protein [Anaerotalea alkaliphila]NDL66813.1 sugar ABC transporter substrate-binding protein [Anaerotalea alkaliphila]
MKKIIAMLLAVLMLGVTGCGSPDPGTGMETGGEAGTGTGGSDDKLVIGYASKNVNDTFQTYLIDAANAYAQENNIDLIVVDAQNDVVKQQDQVNTFVTQGVDALVVLPIDTSATAPMTKAAQDAGIPLVYCNTNPHPDGNFPEGTYYVGSIEKEAGTFQAEYIGELLGGVGNVAILQGSLTHEGALQRTEGVEETLASKYPDIKVVGAQTAEWQRDMAMSVTENWMTANNNDIQAIFANNDEMALGAVNVAQARGMDVKVIGIDGTTDALTAIKAGTLAGSVFQDAEGQARGAMEKAMNVAQGEEVEVISWVPFILITPENVDEFIQ